MSKYSGNVVISNNFQPKDNKGDRDRETQKETQKERAQYNLYSLGCWQSTVSVSEGRFSEFMGGYCCVSVNTGF